MIGKKIPPRVLTGEKFFRADFSLQAVKIYLLLIKIPASIRINAGKTIAESSSPKANVEIKIANIGTRYAKFAVCAVFEVFSSVNAHVKYATASINTPSQIKLTNCPSVGNVHTSQKYPDTPAQIAVVAQIIIIANFCSRRIFLLSTENNP